MTHQERLKFLKVPLLAYRTWRGDMIEVFKIMKNQYDKEAAPFMKPWTQMADI